VSAKHTPRPWQYLDELVSHPVVTSSNFSIEVRGPNEKNDARLIAAAPDLFASLHELCLADKRGELDNVMFERARAAIRKAQGEEA
jgi:hypothetical protein